MLVLLITAATGAWADEVTFSVGELKNSLPSGNTSVEIPYEWTVESQQPKVTIDGTTGTLSVSQVLPLNANYTMTVSVPTGGSIDGVTFITNPKSQAGNISASTGSCSNGTWSPGEGDVTSVTFTPTGTFRLTVIVVDYTPAPAPAGYSVTMPQDTPDATLWTAKAGTDGTYQQLPLEGVAQGAQVSLKYEGALKVKSVRAKKAAPANVPVESLTIAKGSSGLSGDKVLYYLPGDTYRQALARTENQSTGGLGWGYWESSNLTTIFFKEVTTKAWDVAIDGDSNFSSGKGTCNITLDTEINPTGHTFEFVAAQ